MVFLHIDNSNDMMDNETNKNPSLIFNNLIQDNKNKFFILIHMEGCGPCMSTLPEWKKLEHVLHNKSNIIIVDIERNSLNHIKNIKNHPNSFPTMRYITNKGRFIENYEDSDIQNKDRTVDSFIEWINSKIKKDHKFKNKNKTVKNKTRNYYGGRKWSLKYKHSINCRRPKGFSQKQYCKYGRK